MIDLDKPESIDLNKLNAELADLDAQILDLQRRREARKAVIKAVEILKNGKPRRRRRDQAAAANDAGDPQCDSDLVSVVCDAPDDKAAQRIEAYLNQMGAQSPETLARILAIDLERVELILDMSPIFERDKKGRYRLVPTH